MHECRAPKLSTSAAEDPACPIVPAATESPPSHHQRNQSVARSVRRANRRWFDHPQETHPGAHRSGPTPGKPSAPIRCSPDPEAEPSKARCSQRQAPRPSPEATARHPLHRAWPSEPDWVGHDPSTPNHRPPNTPEQARRTKLSARTHHTHPPNSRHHRFQPDTPDIESGPKSIGNQTEYER